LLLSVIVNTTFAIGCSSNEEQKRAELRRQLLRGQDLEKQRNTRFEKERLTTYQGDLLPSDIRVAGVVLPRGFNQKFTFEYEWYYDGAEPLPKLDQYIRKQLDFVSFDHPDPASTQFMQARTKGFPEMKPVTIKIYPVPGRSDWSRIYIRAPQPLPEHILTPEEVSRMVASHRRNE
jgi:hypothetical protein